MSIRRLGSKIRKAVCAIFVDCVCIVLVGVPCLLLMLIGEPFSRGFFCNDESIRHPYKESTVTTPVLILVSYFLPTVIFCLVETSTLKHNNTFTCIKLGRQLYSVVGVFVFGSFVNQLLTDTSKYTIGRLRPHFLQVCNPVNLSVMCGDVHDMTYVTSYSCQGEDNIPRSRSEERIHDSKLSFVSGHASLSVYSMWLSVIYIQRKMVGRDYRLVKPLIQVGCLMFALFSSLTRISDYKHHPGDVVGGALLGWAVATAVDRLLVERQVGKTHIATSTTSLLTVSTSRLYSEEMGRHINPS